MNKANKGVTLISLTIYIILFIITIGILSSITGYFMQNLGEITISEKGEDQFNILLSYINSDLNNSDLIYIKSGKEYKQSTSEVVGEYVVFKFRNDIQHIYLFENNNIYFLNEKVNSNNFDKIIILCKKVTKKNGEDVFKYDKNTLKINMKILENDFSINLNTNLSF